MLTLRLAWRNVWRNRRRSAIVLVAVAVGIAGVMLTMAVNNGMVLQMVDTAIATELGHLQVHAPGYEQAPGIERRLEDGGRRASAALAALGIRAWAPRVRSDALAFSPRASAGVQIVGIDPEREASVSVVARSLVDGRYLDPDARGLLVGEALAERLKVGVGSKIVLSAQDTAGDLVGEAYRVSGVFETASRDFDRRTVFLPLASAQQLLRFGDAVSEVVAVSSSRQAVPGLAAALARRLGSGAEVETWEDLAPLLVQLIEVFDSTAWYVYAAVFIAMLFGIANVLMMAVYERIREIGIVMALGMRPRHLVLMVALESTILTFLGLLLGIGAALAGVAALHDGIDLSRFAAGLTAYGIGTRIVPVIRGQDLGIPLAAAVVTAVLASLWPGTRATRFRPAEAVRHV